MTDLDKLVVALGYLCDGMKRLELALQCTDQSERDSYRREAADRRGRAEKIIMEKLSVGVSKA